MPILCVFIVSVSLAGLVGAEERKPDLTFRYRDGGCRSIDGLHLGRSSGFLGECGEVRGVKDRGILRQEADWTALSAIGWSAEKSVYERIRLRFGTLNSSKWNGSELIGFDARASGWTGARFENTRIDGGDWREANLSGVRSRRTKWVGVDFRGARLRSLVALKSDFIDCDFRDADLRDAVFLLSRFRGSRFNDRTVLPFNRKVARSLGMIHEP